MIIRCQPDADGTVRVFVEGGPLPKDPKYTRGVALPEQDLIVSVYRSPIGTYNQNAVYVHSGIKRVIADPVGAGVKLDLLDTDPPFNQDFYYILGMYDKQGKGVYTEIPGCHPDSTLPPGEIDVATCVPVMISDPARPYVHAWAGVLSIAPLSYPPRRDLYEPLGRSFPVAVSNMRGAARTSIRLITKTDAQRLDMLNVQSSGDVLCFRMTDPDYPEHLMYISVGDLTENRIYPDHRRPERIWELDVAVVQRPVVGVIPMNRFNWHTFAPPAPAHTWDDLRMHFTWAGMLTDQSGTGGLGGGLNRLEPGTHAAATAWKEP